MNILDCSQGTDRWLSIRSSHFTASEAPAMLGLSKYQTRNALLQMKSTGIIPEVDAGTQARFDLGHIAEAQARPLAEAIIGQDLYPITATRDVDGLPLLASFDGVSMDEEIIFEHKLWNKSLANAIEDYKTGIIGRLDPHYTVQINQQLLVSGAKACLFMTSDGTADNMSWCWINPNRIEVQAIVDGWRQFSIDLAAYQPREISEKPQAEAIMQLPALSIQIRGEVTLSNLPQFKEAAATFIDKIKTDLQTDEDFAQAEATVKFCKTAEDDLEAAKKAAIGQTASIDELMRTIDYIQAQLRDKRLVLDKAVKTQKESIKERILVDAKAAYNTHIIDLDAEIRPIRLITPTPDFSGVIKNKRTLASMHDAVDTELARAKIDADAIAKDIRGKLAWFKEYAKGYEALFADLQHIVYKPESDFDLLVETRIKTHKQAEAEKLEAELQRIQKEEQAKAEAKVKAGQEATKNVTNTNPSEAVMHDGARPELAASVTHGNDTLSAAPSPIANPMFHNRPSDNKIIGVLCLHFGVSEQTVRGWLADMNLQAAA